MCEPPWMVESRMFGGPKLLLGMGAGLSWENQAQNSQGQGGAGRQGAAKKKVPWFFRWAAGSSMRKLESDSLGALLS